jgi:hypothetical protein
MDSVCLTFPLKPGTKDKVFKWYSGDPSQWGGFTIDDYRQLLRKFGITKQVWTFQTTTQGEFICVAFEAPDVIAARDAFLNSAGGLETWCKQQLTSQSNFSPGVPDPKGWPDTLTILPYP